MAPDLTVNVAEGTVIRPGDKVVITVDHDTTPEDVARMVEAWEQQMPETCKILDDSYYQTGEVAARTVVVPLDAAPQWLRHEVRATPPPLRGRGSPTSCPWGGRPTPGPALWP